MSSEGIAIKNEDADKATAEDSRLSGANTLPIGNSFNNSLKSRNEDEVLQDLAKQLALRKDEDKHLWRKDYLQKSFYLVGFALYFTFAIIILSSVGLVDISQSVLITLMGSTVAEVIGILIVAFNWLYPHKGEDDEDKASATKGGVLNVDE